MAVNGNAGQRHRTQDRAEHLAALTDKIVDLQGWRRQAADLVHTHTAVGMAALAATEPDRRRQLLKPSTGNFSDVAAKSAPAPATTKVEPADKLNQTSAKSAGPVQHSAEKFSLGRLSIGKMESLTPGERVAGPGSTDEQLEIANCSRQTPLDFIVNETMRQSRVLSDSGAVTANTANAELKVGLGAVREEIVHKENENHSLQTSLDLLMSENSRLSRLLLVSAATGQKRIAELESELGSVRQALLLRLDEYRSLKASLDVANEAHSQLERKQAALLAAEAELDKLALAVDEANEKQRTEINTLHTHLEAVSARAVAAERRVAELEGELGSLRQARLSREDQSRVLEASPIVADKARREFAFKKTTLVAAEAERNTPARAVNKADEKQQSEINTLRYPLVASGRCARANVASADPVELARAVDPCRTTGRRAAIQAILPGAANKQLELLQSSWLRSLGLEQYETAFRDNEIDATVLPNLTAEDLKDLGVGLVGHRRKMLGAIAVLRANAETVQ